MSSADFPDSRFFASHPEALHGAVAAVQLDGVFPLDWVDALTPPQPLGEVMADNNTLLRALLMLDEPPVSHEAEHGRPDPIQNLERRVDLLLLMASAALRGLGNLPPERPCALSSHKLRWASEEALDVGRHVWARIYLRHRIALPLVLPGVITELLPDRGQFWHTLELQGLDATVQNDLDRLIFRHHRRQVARQRKGAPPSAA
ncbi:PilZ domain-containing protein [Thiomonas sp.]|jgi:nucleotide-binding universal stress UspA family protein|uniref:PilZ domain-containing protein n=1 Tax=Thiomonas sp. TaxID=2047785 RepID=UPI002618D3A6|nr:PilZ domain-containing protein [Thiomonas sp.]